MTKSTFSDLSTSPGSNTLIDGNDASENCAMSGINNAIRSLGAMGKGALTFLATTGTDTYVSTFAPVPDALATDFFYGVNFGNANTSTTPTWNPSGLGPKTITDLSGNALVAGALNGRHILVYDGTNFRVLNPALLPAPIADATNGGLNISANKINLKPSDLLTKATPTTSDSIVIMDAANSNVATTATIPAVVGALSSPITNSLGSSVNLTSTSTYFDGPSVAQGTTGTWWVSGSVTVADTSAANAIFSAKLWDGTTVIASGRVLQPAVNSPLVIALSGKLTSPAGNLRISVKGETATSGQILFNNSGNSKDSTITAIRIA